MAQKARPAHIHAPVKPYEWGRAIKCPDTYISAMNVTAHSNVRIEFILYVS
jgi:hypothetical protein